MRKPSVYVLLACIAVMVVFFVFMERRAAINDAMVEVCYECLFDETIVKNSRLT